MKSGVLVQVFTGCRRSKPSLLLKLALSLVRGTAQARVASTIVQRNNARARSMGERGASRHGGLARDRFNAAAAPQHCARSMGERGARRHGE